jgi:hypothetical protein
MMPRQTVKVLCRDVEAPDAVPPPNCRRICRQEPGLADSQQLHVEDQRRVRRDNRRISPRSIAQVWWDNKPPPATSPHACDSLIPSPDDVACAQLEGEGPAAGARAVEFRPIREPARIMHRHLLARPRLGPAPRCHLDILQAAGCRHRRALHLGRPAVLSCHACSRFLRSALIHQHEARVVPTPRHHVGNYRPPMPRLENAPGATASQDGDS